MNAQLSFFAPDAARAEVAQLQAELAWVQEQRETLATRSRALAQEVKALKRELEQCVNQAERDEQANWRLREELFHWIEKATLLSVLRDLGPASPSPSPLPGLLTQLLTIAHPDKWSQGQPATALAHELTVVINQLRTQQGGVA
jgi:hypothetical protein